MTFPNPDYRQHLVAYHHEQLRAAWDSGRTRPNRRRRPRLGRYRALPWRWYGRGSAPA